MQFAHEIFAPHFFHITDVASIVLALGLLAAIVYVAAHEDSKK